LVDRSHSAYGEACGTAFRNTTNCVGGIAPEYSRSSIFQQSEGIEHCVAALPFSWRLLEEVFSQRRENINQHNLFIEHSGAMPAP
jgi:hypothetical protein